MKKQIDASLKKKTLIACIVASAILLAQFIVFVPLACKGIVPGATSRYLSFGSVLVMIWIPYIFLLLRIEFDFHVFLMYLVFIFFATLLGSGWSIYQMVSWYDTVVHFLSGVLIGFIGYTLLVRNSKAKLEYFWLFVFVVAFSVLAGAIWEVYEFVGDTLNGSDMQVAAGMVGHKALLDTMIDIICDLGGGLIAAVCCVLEEVKRRKGQKEMTATTVDEKASVTEPPKQTEEQSEKQTEEKKENRTKAKSGADTKTTNKPNAQPKPRQRKGTK